MLVILWFAGHGCFDVDAYRKARPWYRQKRTSSFADMLDCLRTASLTETIYEDHEQKPHPRQLQQRLLAALRLAG